MNSWYPPPIAPLPREFRMASGGFGRMIVPFLAVLVIFFMVMLLLGAIFLDTTGGIVVAAVATGALIVVMYAKFRRMRDGTVVRFSEHGIELQDSLGFHLQLRWPDITHIGEVDTRMSNPKAINAGGDVTVHVGAMHSLGVIGWGYRAIPPRIPAWMREDLARQPINPVDGRPLVAIPLGGVDPNWAQGAMGEWIRRYRPDLFTRPHR